jgi:hypothetical protein
MDMMFMVDVLKNFGFCLEWKISWALWSFMKFSLVIITEYCKMLGC